MRRKAAPKAKRLMDYKQKIGPSNLLYSNYPGAEIYEKLSPPYWLGFQEIITQRSLYSEKKTIFS